MSNGLPFPPIVQPPLCLQPPRLTRYQPTRTARHVALMCAWVLQVVQALLLLLPHVQQFSPGAFAATHQSASLVFRQVPCSRQLVGNSAKL